MTRKLFVSKKSTTDACRRHELSRRVVNLASGDPRGYPRGELVEDGGSNLASLPHLLDFMWTLDSDHKASHVLK